MEKREIFLSGGNGMIGRNILAKLGDRNSITSPMRSELDLCDETAVSDFFSGKQYDCIIHTAAVGTSRIKSQTHSNENISIFTNLFSQHQSYQSFIHLGSGAEYGRPTPQLCIDENEFGKIIPDDPYGLSKFTCSKKIISAQFPNVISLLLFGVFGPHEDYQSRFISNAIVRSLFNLPIIINQDRLFSYLYVNDLSRILDLMLSKPPNYTICNLTNDEPISLSRLSEMIQSISGNKNEIIVKQKDLAPPYTGTNQRLRNYLGNNFQFTPHEEAIRELFHWYESIAHTLDKDKIINPI